MTDCDHRHKVATTMYVGKRWTCLKCDQEMKCVGVGEHEAIDHD